MLILKPHELNNAQARGAYPQFLLKIKNHLEKNVFLNLKLICKIKNIIKISNLFAILIVVKEDQWLGNMAHMYPHASIF
jgi:hypothetical protein